MREQVASVLSPAARESTTLERTRKPGGTRKFNLSRFATMVFLLVCAIYFLVPFCWLFIASTQTSQDLRNTSGLWFAPHFALFRNIYFLFTVNNSIFVRWVFNTLIYAGGGAVAGTLLSSMAGYAMAKYVFPGRRAIFSVVLGAVLVPSTMLALPLYLMASSGGLTNTYWSVLLPGMVSPFGVYLSRIYADAAVPDDLLEACRIDGASEWRTYTIALHLMLPALATIFLFQFVAIWNNYFLPLIMLTDNNLFPLTVGLSNWGGGTLVVCGSLVSSLPLIVGCIFLQRYWRNGLGTGSIKG
ncbi:MAG: carbohydrate ABC transporter permease [Ktedonobacteraceae bacterium]|nr:carbohydrate ABC transporter permease [Ktedonobacteraceae bacterium]